MDAVYIVYWTEHILYFDLNKTEEWQIKTMSSAIIKE